MKKIFFAALLMLCFSLSAFAADTWTFTVREVGKPGLTNIRVQFTVNLNGTAYVTDEVTVTAQELDGKTVAQRKAYLADQIKAKIAPYIQTYNNAAGLETFVGQEFAAQ